MASYVELYYEYLEYQQELEDASKQALKEGRKKGRPEGAKEKRIEIAKNLLAEGLDIELISKTTELTIEQIKELKE